MTTQERIELIEAMWKFSERISTSKFIPQYMRGDVATTFHAVATGQDLGLSWTHAPRSIFPSPEGGMGMKGDVILALLLAHNKKEE